MLKPTRQSFIPRGAVAVSDKRSSAVAYLYEDKGVYYGIGFHGRAQKPDWHYHFKNLASRERHIVEHFAGIQQREARQSELRAEARGFRHSYKIGDLFNNTWGYDQTNVNWYEVTAVRGQMIEIREIGTAYKETGFMCGKCSPLPGSYIGEPKWRRAQEGRVKVNHHQHASFVKPKMVAGVPTYEASYTSSYA
jgi:hypothetical protein